MPPLGEKEGNAGGGDGEGRKALQEGEELVQEFILPGYNDGVYEGEGNGENERYSPGGFRDLPMPLEQV